MKNMPAVFPKSRSNLFREWETEYAQNVSNLKNLKTNIERETMIPNTAIIVVVPGQTLGVSLPYSEEIMAALLKGTCVSVSESISREVGDVYTFLRARQTPRLSIVRATEIETPKEKVESQIKKIDEDLQDLEKQIKYLKERKEELQE